MAALERCLLFTLALSIGGCGDEFSVPGPDCAPLYEPTWENVHEQTLSKSCAVGGGCHSAPGALGLVLSDPDSAHAMLLAGLVEAGSPEDSELMYRLSPEAGGDQMPPGGILPESERCAIASWIREGANP